MLLEYCDAKHLCIVNTWLRKADKKSDKSEIDFCIMGKVDRKLLKNVKVITGELQHSLVIGDIDKKQTNKTQRKPESQKRNVATLRDETYRQLFECRVNDIMSDSHNDLWGSIKGVQMACVEVCGYKKNKKCNVNTWWCNSGAKDEIQNKNKSI